MTKILYIHGDDYAYSDFKKVIDNKEISAEELWHLSNTKDWVEWESETSYFQFSAYEFGDIDPKFIDFVKNELIDYDAGKAANIYLVE